MITETDYQNEVEKQANILSNHSESESSLVEEVTDVLDAHSWFYGSNKLSGSEYGAIISDFSHYGNVEQYRDPASVVDPFDFTSSLRNMAFSQFEADVVATAEKKM